MNDSNIPLGATCFVCGDVWCSCPEIEDMSDEPTDTEDDN